MPEWFRSPIVFQKYTKLEWNKLMVAQTSFYLEEIAKLHIKNSYQILQFKLHTQKLCMCTCSLKTKRKWNRSKYIERKNRNKNRGNPYCWYSLRQKQTNKNRFKKNHKGLQYSTFPYILRWQNFVQCKIEKECVWPVKMN